MHTAHSQFLMLRQRQAQLRLRCGSTCSVKTKWVKASSSFLPIRSTLTIEMLQMTKENKRQAASQSHISKSQLKLDKEQMRFSSKSLSTVLKRHQILQVQSKRPQQSDNNPQKRMNKNTNKIQTKLILSQQSMQGKVFRFLKTLSLRMRRQTIKAIKKRAAVDMYLVSSQLQCLQQYWIAKFTVIIIKMSNSQSQMESEESVPIKKRVLRQSSSSNTSSDDGESYITHNISVNVDVARQINQIKKQASSIKNYEDQIFQLKKHNIELRDQNSKLMELIKHNREDKILKKQLSEKEKEIQELKRKISESLYYESSKTSKISHAIPVQIEDKRYRLHRKSIKSKQRDSVSSDETESVKLHAFDHTSQINKIKAEKLTLEKHFYELQEKMLILEHETKWMRNLAAKLVNFAEKLSFVFKEQIFHANWNLLKKAKSSWRYMKHILKFVLNVG